MSYSKERAQFLKDGQNEGIPWADCLALLRAATSLNRYAELSCSDEASDRDRVACPNVKDKALPCICSYTRETDTHSDVPRIDVKAQAVELRVARLLAALSKQTGNKYAPEFGGDPRGAVLRLHVPSGRHEGWGGLAVPSGPSGLTW